MFRVALLVALLVPPMVPLLVPSIAAADQPGWNSFGFAAARAAAVDSQSSWLERGFGRLSGGDEVGDVAGWGRAEAQLGLTFDDQASWRGKLHVLARLESSDVVGDPVGITEAWLNWQRALGNRDEFSARAGIFFYPSSQENIDPLWGSPYTLTYSAINSWMAEEFRPIGLDLTWRRFLSSGDELSLGATVFGGNDTLGTLIAWRGWAMHDRLTVLGERLALPEAFSLEPDRVFGEFQRAFKTTPIGRDLDGRPGYALRLRGERPGRMNAQVAWVDNRGDRDLHGSEYAWHTRFWLAGMHWQASDRIEFMAEWTEGETIMGFPGNPWVKVEFRALYGMASLETAIGRWSLRHDRFVADDRLANPNWGLYDDRGQAWTLAWMLPLGQRSRFGLEWLWLDSNRTLAAQSLGSANTDGRMLSAEWRLHW